MLLIELFFSIHLLLFLSSWFINIRWLKNTPSFKLNLVRFLLISCVLSPVIVHCIKPAEKPLILKFVSLDRMQEYASKPIIKFPKTLPSQQVMSLKKIAEINFWQIAFSLFGMMILFRGYRFFTNLKHLKSVLHTAIPYRSCGKLVIKVSHDCHIPFSVRLLNKAYIVLPVSLLSTSQHVKIAIAHEGQHLRQGDCLWAYFIESLRLIFFGNPGVTRWHKMITELQELSCDEALVSCQKISAHDYGHCLFHVARTVSQYPNYQGEFPCMVGMALSDDKQDSDFIIRRINMLTNYRDNTSKRLLLGICFAGLAIVVPICTAYAAMGSLSRSKIKEINISALDPKIQKIAAEEISDAVKR